MLLSAAYARAKAVLRQHEKELHALAQVGAAFRLLRAGRTSATPWPACRCFMPTMGSSCTAAGSRHAACRRLPPTGADRQGDADGGADPGAAGPRQRQGRPRRAGELMLAPTSAAAASLYSAHCTAQMAVTRALTGGFPAQLPDGRTRINLVNPACAPCQTAHCIFLHVRCTRCTRLTGGSAAGCQNGWRCGGGVPQKAVPATAGAIRSSVLFSARGVVLCAFGSLTPP